MQFSSIIALLLLAGGVNCYADGIASSFMCSVDSLSGPISTSNSTGCDITGPDGTLQMPQAQALMVGGSMPLFFSPVATFKASVFLSSTAKIGSMATFGPFFDAQASAQTNWSITASSAGPERTGIIELDLTACSQISPGNSSEASSAQVGSYSSGQCGLLTKAPFELGVPFSISMSALASGWANSDGDGGGTSDASIQFSLFEADGVTPVDTFSVTPEPSAAVPMFIALLIACGMKRRAASRRS